ncbi:centrosomal protein [Ditylenchus destructor]|nr:centrosomal protein [Ditylenchus destructor]
MSSNKYITYETYREQREREQRTASASISSPQTKSNWSDQWGSFSTTTSSKQPKSVDAASDGRLYHTAASSRTPYDMVSNDYIRNGFCVTNSQLGNDPLTSLRTAKNRIHRIVIDSTVSGQQIRANLAEAAIMMITRAELVVQQLLTERSMALFNGDSRTAEILTQRAKDIHDDALFNAYSDLLLTKDEANSFGINSIWTPSIGHQLPQASYNPIYAHSFGEHNPQDRSRKKVKKQRHRSQHRRRKYSAESQNEPETSSSQQTRKNAITPKSSPDLFSLNRSHSESASFLSQGLKASKDSDVVGVNSNYRTNNGRDIEINTSFPSVEIQPALTKQGFDDSYKEVKKNRRLADGPTVGTYQNVGDQTDSAAPAISSAVICPYCNERDPGFVNADYLKQHFAANCNPLTKCEFCDKIIEVSELNNHHLSRCPFVEDNLKPCELCGLARFPDKANHPKCRGKKPADGGAWCPLCSALVLPSNSKETWLAHLRNACYNNSRSWRWSQADWERLEDDPRGDDLLANLNKEGNDRKTGLYAARPVQGTSQAGPSKGQQAQQPIIDPDQMRSAIKRLNHEHRINRARSAAAAAHRRAHDADSEDGN